MRPVGITALALWALTVYFIVVRAYLDKGAVAPVDHALATAVGISAGACAIPATVLGLYFLTVRDRELMQTQREAVDASVEPPSGDSR
jgi:hypothetical protein